MRCGGERVYLFKRLPHSTGLDALADVFAAAGKKPEAALARGAGTCTGGVLDDEDLAGRGLECGGAGGEDEVAGGPVGAWRRGECGGLRHDAGGGV